MYKTFRNSFSAAGFLTVYQSYPLMTIAFDSTFLISISGSGTFSAAERGNTEGIDIKRNRT
jgi:hypothetical protein